MKVSQQNPDSNSVNECSVPSDLTASDTDSMSPGSTSTVQDVGGVVAKGKALRDCCVDEVLAGDRVF